MCMIIKLRGRKTETFFLLGLWGVTWSSSSAIFGGSFQRHVRIFWTRPRIGAHCNVHKTDVFTTAFIHFLLAYLHIKRAVHNATLHGQCYCAQPVSHLWQATRLHPPTCQLQNLKAKQDMAYIYIWQTALCHLAVLEQDRPCATWHDTDINDIHEDVSNAVQRVCKTHTVKRGIIGIRNLSTGRI